jgi:hypothetical protein
MTSNLLELADRCEKATEGSFELNAAISEAVLGPSYRPVFPGGIERANPFFPDPFDDKVGSPRPWNFTGSVEAAEHALPGPDWPEWQITRRFCTGYHANIGTGNDGVGCATPALALCAAALKARASQGAES